MYDSGPFDELLKLDNYDDILSLDCSSFKLNELPNKLPANLYELYL